MPPYRRPNTKNLFLASYNAIKSFVKGAGKIILVLSILLWGLASFGPTEKNNSSGNKIISQPQIENSYLGHIGKTIEPAIKPLGFDWKIGIALVASFAAREVFVSTLATIYSVENIEDNDSIKTTLKHQINPITHQPIYTLAVGMSLMIFYAFAMQCMSTLGAIYNETKSYKYPIISFLVMNSIAYLCAWLTFNLLK